MRLGMGVLRGTAEPEELGKILPKSSKKELVLSLDSLFTGPKFKL